MAALFALGFSSGLPLLLTSHTLQAWLATRDVDLDRIALMSVVGLAYSLKFLWAPLFDRFRLPLLGRRRGWVLAFQLGLIVAIAAMGTVDPVGQPYLLAAIAAVVALLSASQDVVLDAYSTDVLEPHERAAGSAIYVVGYRVGMLVAGTAALILADHVSWRAVYAAMAAAMGLGVIATLVAEEPAAPARPVPSVARAVVEAVRELVAQRGRAGVARLLAFAALYELGYFFAQAIIMPFLTRGCGFQLTEIAEAYKLMVFAGTAVGGAIAGAVVARLGVRRMLVPFGALAALTHLAYVALALAGHDVVLLCVAVGLDSIANAMVISVFVAVVMSACTRAVSATQYAVLTSLASLGQRALGPLASHVEHAVGWAGFFVVTALLALPGLIAAGVLAREPER